MEEVQIAAGRLRVPTLPEILRVKAWLVLDRNATRDYLDVVALAERLGEGAAAEVLSVLDDYYADQRGADGRRVATQVTKQLAELLPYDLDSVDLEHYRRLAPRWRSWSNVADASRRLAGAVLDAAARLDTEPDRGGPVIHRHLNHHDDAPSASCTWSTPTRCTGRPGSGAAGSSRCATAGPRWCRCRCAGCASAPA